MRSFVRPQTGPRAEVDLNSLIREVAEMYRFEAERAEVRILLDLAAHNTRVLVDRKQCNQERIKTLWAQHRRTVAQQAELDFLADV